MSDRVRIEPAPLPRLARRLAWAMALALTGGALGACEEDEVPSGADNPTDWTSQGALMTAPTKAPRTIAAMMFDIGGGAPNATNIMNVIGGTGSSQRHMYQEISYGIQDTAPEYFGPYTLPVHDCLTIACCGPSSDQTGNGATVASLISGLGKTFNHYFWVYGAIPAGANCGTWGDEGSPNKIATYSSYSFHQIVGYAQEIGHNFGMTHEPIMNCTGNVTFLDNTAAVHAQGVRQRALASWATARTTRPRTTSTTRAGSAAATWSRPPPPPRSRWCRRSSRATACSWSRSRRPRPAPRPPRAIARERGRC